MSRKAKAYEVYLSESESAVQITRELEMSKHGVSQIIEWAHTYSTSICIF